MHLAVKNHKIKNTYLTYASVFHRFALSLHRIKSLNIVWQRT